MEDIFKKAIHNPPHLFRPNATYMLTASTYKGQPIMATTDRKQEWHKAFLESAKISGWQIIAWVVLQNHYHTIIESPANPLSLSKFVGSYHKYTARLWNAKDGFPGRRVWWNYWDTCIRSEQDYIARLQYIFWNPVKHGVVQEPTEYLHSNYQEFLTLNWFDVGSTLVEVDNVPEF